MLLLLVLQSLSCVQVCRAVDINFKMFKDFYYLIMVVDCSNSIFCDIFVQLNSVLLAYTTTNSLGEILLCSLERLPIITQNDI